MDPAVSPVNILHIQATRGISWKVFKMMSQAVWAQEVISKSESRCCLGKSSLWWKGEIGIGLSFWSPLTYPVLLTLLFRCGLGCHMHPQGTQRRQFVRLGCKLWACFILSRWSRKKSRERWAIWGQTRRLCLLPFRVILKFKKVNGL